MKKEKACFACSECGASYARWVGRCTACGAWDAVGELGAGGASGGRDAIRLDEIAGMDEARTGAASEELNRVLGGGFVRGGVVLLAGDPGIGKSTLALQMTSSFRRTFYVAGEESPGQIRMRADRLNVPAERIVVGLGTRAEQIVAAASKHEPELLVVDSIQTVQVEHSESPIGGVNQVRESAAMLIRAAKERNIPAVLIGHVTRSGDVAGPMVLEHLVDTVLFLEPDASGAYRVLRSLKNRYGATDETGLFRMTDAGMVDLENPSEVLLPSNRVNRPGSAVTASLEGRRPLVLELQALTVPSAFGTPRRVATGVDPNRLAMLLAVLERRGGIATSRDDVYVNPAGGFRLKEPAADLGIIAAVASGANGVSLPERAIFCGEVGLGGEIRPVSRVDARLREAAGLGFSVAFVSRGQKVEKDAGIKVRAFDEIKELLCTLFA